MWWWLELGGPVWWWLTFLWYEERRAIWRAATCERRVTVHNRLPPSPARARHVRSCKRVGA